MHMHASTGDTLVVGARVEDGCDASEEDDNDCFNSGAAYVFVRSGVSWSQQQYLKASNPGTADYFGHSVRNIIMPSSTFNWYY